MHIVSFRNLTFKRYNSEKKLLKSVYIYESYRKIKTGVSLLITMYTMPRVVIRMKGQYRSYGTDYHMSCSAYVVELVKLADSLHFPIRIYANCD